MGWPPTWARRCDWRAADNLGASGGKILALVEPFSIKWKNALQWSFAQTWHLKAQFFFQEANGKFQYRLAENTWPWTRHKAHGVFLTNFRQWHTQRVGSSSVQLPATLHMSSGFGQTGRAFLRCCIMRLDKRFLHVQPKIYDETQIQWQWHNTFKIICTKYEA